MNILQKYIIKIGLPSLTFVAFVFIVMSGHANAAIPYNPALLIDDSTFSNSNTMAASTIQNFLNDMNSGIRNYSEVEACNPSTPTAPYPSTYSYYPHCGQIESAATIIYDAGQAYGINPQVLLATMQKEQSLVTDPSPTQGAIDCAMGYESCGNGYNTFFSQVDNAAWQLRTNVELMNGHDWWGYTPSSYACKNPGYGTFNNINGQPTSMMLYSTGLMPNATVTFGNPAVYYNVNGSWQLSNGQVPAVQETETLLSSATAALYCYTPYVGPSYITGYSGSYNFVLSMYEWFQYPSQIYIPNGNYNIIGIGSGKNMDVIGGSTADGTNIDLYENNGTGAQQWTFTRDADGYYTIKNTSSGKYLDVTYASTTPGTRVQIWDGNSSCAQEWAIQAVGSDYMFINACSGLALDALGNGNTNGTPIQIFSKNFTSAQLWTIRSLNPAPVADGFYSLLTTAGTAMDIRGGSTTNGSPLQIYSSNGTGAQQWQLIQQPNGLYELRNPQSGKYLDVMGAGTVSGTLVDIYDGNNTCAQEWAISQNTDGSYGLVSSCSTLNLDVSGDNVSTNGTAIDVWTNNGSGAQKWTLNKLTSIPSGIYSLITSAGNDLDIRGGSTTNGSPLQIYSSNGTGAQQWRIIQQTNGTYEFLNPQSGRYLDVVGAGTTNGTLVDIYDGNNTCAQKWTISENTDGSYGLVSSCSTLKLDVSGGLIGTLGIPIDIWANNGTNAQNWFLVP